MDAITIIILLVLFVGAFILGQKLGATKRDKYWEEIIPEEREDAIMRSRAVLGGHFSENLAPYLPNFPFLPNECRFIGKPIDFIVFEGADEKDISEVVFVEVKSGNAKLSPHESKLKETIQKKRVRWEEYRIPSEITKKGDIQYKIDSIVHKIKEEKAQVSEKEELGYHDRVKKIKQSYRNAYAPWSKNDEAELVTLFKQNMSIEHISNTLGRQPSSIRAKLIKLGELRD